MFNSGSFKATSSSFPFSIAPPLILSSVAPLVTIGKPYVVSNFCEHSSVPLAILVSQNGNASENLPEILVYGFNQHYKFQFIR